MHWLRHCLSEDLSKAVHNHLKEIWIKAYPKKYSKTQLSVAVWIGRNTNLYAERNLEALSKIMYN